MQQEIQFLHTFENERLEVRIQTNSINYLILMIPKYAMNDNSLYKTQ